MVKNYALTNSHYKVQKNLSLKGIWISSTEGLSKEALKRLKWFEHYNSKGKNASLTCRYFGISRKIFYKWKKRFKWSDLSTLENRKTTPKNKRISEKFMKYRFEVKRVREAYPTWSKYMIGAKLRAQGYALSDSTVGYILTKLRLINKAKSRRWKRSRKRNQNKIRIRNANILINQPGALVQIDTKEYNALGEGKFIQFTAVDCFSRKRVLRAYGKKSAKCGKKFIKQIISEFGFDIHAILTDGGSEFHGDFDDMCKELNIPHYWTDPYSPEQNAYVESSHNTDQREFYNVYIIEPGLEGFRRSLKIWQRSYNSDRPHSSLGYISPDIFLKNYFARKEAA
jgi:transposase InsO family protein